MTKRIEKIPAEHQSSSKEMPLVFHVILSLISLRQEITVHTPAHPVACHEGFTHKHPLGLTCHSLWLFLDNETRCCR